MRINKDKEKIKDLEWENGSLEVRLKERTQTAFMYLALFLFLMVVFIISTVQNRNLMDENALIKSQVTNWDLKIHCEVKEQFSGYLSGTTDFDLKFKNYQDFKIAKKEILSNFKDSDEILNCEVIYK